MQKFSFQVIFVLRNPPVSKILDFNTFMYWKAYL